MALRQPIPSFRAFGRSESDLNIDFSLPRPQLITEILVACGGLKDDVVLRLTVGKRTEYLALVATLSSGQDIATAPQCQSCGQRIEVTFSADELASLQREAERSAPDDRLPIRLGDRQVAFRRPTGADQIRWQQMDFSTPSEAMTAMLQTLLVEPGEAALLSKSDVEQISEALDRFDPLVNFSFDSECPYCGVIHVYIVDLQGTMLDMLRRVQMRMFDDIHRLALNYHWREEEIVVLPTWRRQHYLNLIDRETSR